MNEYFIMYDPLMRDKTVKKGSSLQYVFLK